MAGAASADAPGHFDAVHAGHPHVHEDDIGGELAGGSNHFLARRGLASDHDDLVGELQARCGVPSRVTGWSSTISARIGDSSDIGRDTLLHHGEVRVRCVQDRTKWSGMRACTKRSRLTQEATVFDARDAPRARTGGARALASLRGAEPLRPELGLNIVDLGLVYDVQVHDDGGEAGPRRRRGRAAPRRRATGVVRVVLLASSVSVSSARSLCQPTSSNRLRSTMCGRRSTLPGRLRRRRSASTRCRWAMSARAASSAGWPSSGG